MRPLWLLAALSCQHHAVTAVPIAPFRLANPPPPRLVLYHQTTHDPRTHEPVPLLPLARTGLTHLVLSTLHVRAGRAVHLNDHPASSPHFARLWAEAGALRAAGVRVMAMVGGMAPGSWANETLGGADGAVFEAAYGPLADVVRAHALQGLDLDIEQAVSLDAVVRLVRRLRADFGERFELSLSPIASALRGGSNISGFDYLELEREVGPLVSFYNAQFYNGFGDVTDVGDFVAAVESGWPPEKIVIGQVTTEEYGWPFVPPAQLAGTIAELHARFGRIGGVMGWEYFRSEPQPSDAPWRWAEVMSEMLGCLHWRRDGGWLEL